MSLCCEQHGDYEREIDAAGNLMECPRCEGLDTGAIHRAPLEAEIARLTAELADARARAAAAELAQGAVEEVQAELAGELAAEREKRAEAETREQRLRDAIGAVLVQASARPDLSTLLRALAEPADGSALRAHVAVAVERTERETSEVWQRTLAEALAGRERVEQVKIRAAVERVVAAARLATIKATVPDDVCFAVESAARKEAT